VLTINDGKMSKKIRNTESDDATSCKEYYHSESRDLLLIGANIALAIGVGAIIVLFMLVLNSLGIINLNILAVRLSPPHTFYLASNAFPITAYGNMDGINVTYVFYGAMQSNGTECINSVAVYPFNYTSQSYSSTPEVTTYIPKEVAEIYYSNNIYSSFNMANGKPYLQYDGDTLLCPTIINAIK